MLYRSKSEPFINKFNAKHEKKIKKLLFFWVFLFLYVDVYAFCSVKILITDKGPFIGKPMQASIGNLLIPPCEYQARSLDPKVKENCAVDPDSTLYVHPSEESTCRGIDGYKVTIISSAIEVSCFSAPQTSLNKEIKLKFPLDFKCYGY